MQGMGHDTARAWPRYDQGLATARPSMRHNTARNMAGSARVAWLVECVTIQLLYRDMMEAWPGVCRDTKFCIVTGARAWPLEVVSQFSLYIVIGERSG